MIEKIIHYLFLFQVIIIFLVQTPFVQADKNNNGKVISNSRKICKIWISSRDELNKLANFVEPMEVHQDHVIADLTERTFNELIDMGFMIEVLYENTEELNNFILNEFPEAGAEGLYHSYSEIKAELKQLESLNPEIAKVYDIGDSWEKSQGIADRDILAIKISDNVELDENEPEILFIGCHHAREWISVEVPFYLAKYLVENYDTDPIIRSYVDNGEIWIIPMLNPDGHQYTIDVDRWWRKNRMNNGGGDCGVDLNRNYGYMWGGSGSSGYAWSDIYRGPEPFSEPETQAIRDLALIHDFQAVISYHNYGQLILYPWSYTSDFAPDKEHLNLMAHDMARLVYAVHNKKYTPRQGSELYPASGGLEDWFYGELGIFGFNIELRPEGYPYFLLPESEIIPTFEENKPAALFLIAWTQSPETPIPDIKANGSDEPVTIAYGTNLNVRISLNPGRKDGLKADWWIEAKTPSGRYWYTPDRRWIRSKNPIPASNDVLFFLTDYEILDTSKLPAGEYTFRFGVDSIPNGIPDSDTLNSDTVKVFIE